MLKIKAQKENLISALSKALPIVDKKTIMTIINNVLLYTAEDQLVVEATDLEISFRTIIPSEVIDSGSITINARKLYEIIKEINEPSIILEELDNHWLRIPIGDKAEYTIAGLAPDEFPKFRDFPNKEPFVIPGKVLKELIERTIFSVSYDDRKYALSGILLEIEKSQDGQGTTIRMVSSDGHRLNLAEHTLESSYDEEEKFSVIILRKGANELKKLSDAREEILLNADEKFLYVKSDNDQLVIRLIEGAFPDYTAIIPKEKNRSFYFNKKDVLAALKRISIVIQDPSFKGIKASISPNMMKLESLDKKIGQAEEKLEISYSGEPFELAFNARYLIEVLQVMKSDTVEMTFNDEDSPIIVEGEDDKGFTALIMPMSLEDE
ncbi:MAG: DNA polymerase III subunit beta [Thermodesulfobacteria bacterium]|nr:DNA polymerase III subunit beta [Thermodesulfobacteriota bacterium]